MRLWLALLLMGVMVFAGSLRNVEYTENISCGHVDISLLSNGRLPSAFGDSAAYALIDVLAFLSLFSLSLLFLKVSDERTEDFVDDRHIKG